MRKFLHFTSAGIVSRENVSCGQNSIPTITFPIIIRWQMDTPLCFLGPALLGGGKGGNARTLDNLNCTVRGQKISSGNKPRRGCVRCLFARDAIVEQIVLYMLFGLQPPDFHISDSHLSESLRSFTSRYLSNL